MKVESKDNMREKEFKKVKELIKEFYEQADCGIFNTRNIAGDSMMTIFNGEYFTLDICFSWAYFEVFGTTEEEFAELTELYNSME